LADKFEKIGIYLVIFDKRFLSINQKPRVYLWTGKASLFLALNH